MALHSQWNGNKVLQFYDDSNGQVILEIDATNDRINWPTGSKITVNGVDITASLAAGSVAGVASGYKLARGVHTPISASDTIVTGLGTVVAAVCSLELTPTLTHMWSSVTIGDQAGTPAAGSIIMASRKPTGTGDVTPADATTPWGPVAWVAIGTA